MEGGECRAGPSVELLTECPDGVDGAHQQRLQGHQDEARHLPKLINEIIKVTEVQ